MTFTAYGMTYRELLHALHAMPPERLDDTASIQAGGEYFEIMSVATVGPDDDMADILDPGHVFLITNI